MAPSLAVVIAWTVWRLVLPSPQGPSVKGGSVNFTVWIQRIGAKLLGCGGSQESPEAVRKESTEKIHLAAT